MTRLNRWNHETRDEAIDNFWEMVDFIGGLAQAPDWPARSQPVVDEWETVGDDALTMNDDVNGLPPWKAEADEDFPPWRGERWRQD